MMINGKLVLVSGASSGIGAATAKTIAKAGGRVVLLARRKEALDQIAADVTSAGGQARTYSVDLADADAVAAVAKQITKNWEHRTSLSTVRGQADGFSSMKRVLQKRFR